MPSAARAWRLKEREREPGRRRGSWGEKEKDSRHVVQGIPEQDQHSGLPRRKGRVEEEIGGNVLFRLVRFKE